MSDLNFNEIGQVIRINAGKDISASIPALILSPEFGYDKVITAGVTIGTEEVTVNEVIYYPDEYIQYTTVKDDLDYVGRWRKKVVLNFSSDNIEQTNFIKFRVLP